MGLRARRRVIIILMTALLFCGLSGLAQPGREAAQGPPLVLGIESSKQIFSSREGLVLQFTWTAKGPVKLCLAKDLLSQVQIDISRSGRGKLPVQPLTLRDNSRIFQEAMRVYRLKAGESITRRANLKRYRFNEDEGWVPGEYNVAATFHLCEQTAAETVTDPGTEIPIRAARPAWFMIMI
jgi:hypothetical protein